jgi:hypothetical protein
MKNKFLKELSDWIDKTPQLTRAILKEKIEEIDKSVKPKRTPKKQTVSVRFTTPLILEIRNYCIERNNGIDAEQFFDFYQSKNWMIGKNKMKDWKAAIRTWERNRPKTEPQNETKYGRMNEQQALGTFSAANNVKIPSQ